MSEREFELVACGVDYVCDDCDKGVMLTTGKFLASDPPKWEHKCSNCGVIKNLSERYPTVRHKRRDGL